MELPRMNGKSNLALFALHPRLYFRQLKVLYFLIDSEERFEQEFDLWGRQWHISIEFQKVFLWSRDFDFSRQTMALNWDSPGKSSLKTVNECLWKTLLQNIFNFSQNICQI